MGRRSERAVASGNGTPWRSPAGKLCAPISWAVVGARSASVTRSVLSPATTIPGAVDHQRDALEVHPDAGVARARILRHQRDRLVGVVRAVERAPAAAAGRPSVPGGTRAGRAPCTPSQGPSPSPRCTGRGSGLASLRAIQPIGAPTTASATPPKPAPNRNRRRLGSPGAAPTGERACPAIDHHGPVSDREGEQSGRDAQDHRARKPDDERNQPTEHGEHDGRTRDGPGSHDLPMFPEGVPATKDGGVAFPLRPRGASCACARGRRRASGRRWRRPCRARPRRSTQR